MNAKRLQRHKNPKSRSPSLTAKGKLRTTKLVVEIALLAILVNLLFISRASSSVMTNKTILSSGTIVTTSTTSLLHVEGNKIKDANGNVVYLRGVNYFHWKADQTKVWLTSSGTVVGASQNWDTQVKPAIIQNFDK